MQQSDGLGARGVSDKMQRVLCVPFWIEAFPSLAISMVPTGSTVRFAVVDGAPFELVKQLTGPVKNEGLVF